MTEKQIDLEEAIAAFTKERDEVLMSKDVDRVIAFQKKHNPGYPGPTDHKTAEIGMHKAITACLSLPLKVRMESREWLKQKGFRSLDSGTLPDELH